MKRILLYVLLLAFTWSAKAETYVVVVGIAKYQYVNDLVLPENDAKAIAKLYKTRTKNVITMTGRYATKANIVKALRDQFRRAKKGDMIVFFFSGHGCDDGFCPYDYNIGVQEKNLLSYEDIYAVFRQSNASRKVVIADACLSGRLRQERPSTNHRTHPFRSDVLMFLSSRNDEISIERPKMRNGFFTTFLERGLRGGADTNKDRLVTAKEIFVFVSNGVKQISKDRQHPVMWGNFDDDFVMMDWRR